MWLVSLRDLQFRARRFVIAILVTSLVFGIALAIDGMRRSVEDESPAIVGAVRRRPVARRPRHHRPVHHHERLRFVAQDDVRGAAGREAADAVVLSRAVVSGPPAKDANLIGHAVGGLGSPPISEGRATKAG